MDNQKGERNGLCNITSCQSPDNVVWLNHSNEKYYCFHCAQKLNDDPYNHADALKLYGHQLCTLED